MAYINTMAPEPTRTGWVRPILFDNAARNWLVADSRSARATGNFLSDLALYGSIAHVAIDAIGFAMIAEKNTDVGWQMLVMDAEAYATTLLLVSVTKRFARRSRPYTRGCSENPTYAENCDQPDRFASFYSGHAAISATSAGLICAQHTRLSLYGGAADKAACYDAIVLTSLTGALRIISDNHWASDVILGHTIGFATGYLMPRLLHFHRAPSPTQAPGLRVRVVPMLGDRIGVSAIGVF